MLHLGQPVGYARQLAEVDAELVFLHARRDLGMGVRIYFRIDTQGDGGHLLLGRCQFVDHLQFSQ